MPFPSKIDEKTAKEKVEKPEFKPVIAFIDQSICKHWGVQGTF